MSTIIKAELSEKSTYYISKERHLELVHFCRQFKDWVEEYKQQDIRSVRLNLDYIPTTDISDITADAGIKKAKLSKKIKMVNTTAYKAVKATCPWLEDPQPIVDALIEGIITETRYDGLGISDIISQDRYYKVYRRFFWELDKIRD